MSNPSDALHKVFQETQDAALAAVVKAVEAHLNAPAVPPAMLPRQ